jgi:hypothetical protein
MSNFLAIATVTAALKQVLHNGVADAVTGADVTIVRPSTTNEGLAAARINVFLYRVSPNPALRNANLPARNSDGDVVGRPQAALDLHYLLTFYGDEAKQEPQRLLGHAVRVLNDQPVLSAEIINDVTFSPPPDWAHLADSDLIDQVDRVRFTPVDLELEELSKLWSTFFQVSYSLSMVYRASVVLIEAERVPRATLPVAERKLYVIPLRTPVIDSISSQEGAGAPITVASTLVIRGKRLRGEVTVVCIGDDEFVATALSDSEIKLPVPTSLPAGIQGLRVVHKIPMGAPEEHRGPESNVAPFVLLPTVVTATVVNSSGVTVTFNPVVGRRQKVLLLLNESDPPSGREPYAYVFPAPVENGLAGSEDDTTSSITFAVSGVEPATYLVRVSVDRAISALRSDKEVDF